MLRIVVCRRFGLWSRAAMDDVVEVVISCVDEMMVYCSGGIEMHQMCATREEALLAIQSWCMFGGA